MSVKTQLKKGKANKAVGKSEVKIEMIKALGNLGHEWVYILLERYEVQRREMQGTGKSGGN